MRDRLLMPILIPVGVAGMIALLIMSMGKILLELDPHISTAVAITIGLLILAVCTLLANGPRIPAAYLYTITALPVAIILGIGLYLAARPSEGEGHGGAVATVTSWTETATDNKFSVTAVAIPVNTEVTLDFQNTGQALHNWKLLDVTDAGGKPVGTELLAGGKSQSLKFTMSKTGTFNFHCEVHPAEMTGTLTVVEGSAAGAAAEPGGSAAGGNTIVATDNKFDKTTMTVKANESTTVNFENKGSAVHNWHVLNVKDTGGKDVANQLIPGGKSEAITFTIDKPGTYDYQCDAHPTEMKGKLTVQ